MKTLGAIELSKLTDVFTDIKHVQKHGNGTSATVLLSATRTHDRKNVFIKVTRCITPEYSDNSLFIEAEIYNQVTNQLIAQQITPHVIPGYGVYMCDDFKRAINDVKDHETIFQEYTNLHRNCNGAMLLVTPFIAGTTLLNYLRTTDTDKIKMSKLSILFQIVYTLHVFNLNNVRHNDLLFHNILIEECKDEPFFYEVAVGEWYKVHTHGVCIKIFDFDLSVWKHRNTYIDVAGICRNYGKCNNINPYTDLFQVLKLFTGQYPTFEKSIGEVLAFSTDNSTLYEDHAYENAHDMCKRDDAGKCAGEYPISGKQLLAPLGFIRKFELFKEFKV